MYQKVAIDKKNIVDTFSAKKKGAIELKFNETIERQENYVNSVLKTSQDSLTKFETQFSPKAKVTMTPKVQNSFKSLMAI